MKRVNDDELITALICHGSVRKAAKALGISPKTITNRMQDPELKVKYEAAKSAQLSEVCQTMTATLSGAVQTLVTVMQDKETPSTVKVSAADSLLRHGLRYLEIAELERRISALEKGDKV